MANEPVLSSPETKAAEAAARVIATQALPHTWYEEQAILASFMAM
jgi:hypothetical protein